METLEPEHFSGQMTTNLLPIAALLKGAILGASKQVIFIGGVPALVLKEKLLEEKVPERFLSAPRLPL